MWFSRWRERRRIRWLGRRLWSGRPYFNGKVFVHHTVAMRSFDEAMKRLNETFSRVGQVYVNQLHAAIIRFSNAMAAAQLGSILDPESWVDAEITECWAHRHRCEDPFDCDDDGSMCRLGVINTELGLCGIHLRAYGLEEVDG